ncbi:MAG: roadblock/LC7 domain-containing protein [Gemmatimonadales bacterium]
MRSVEPWVVEPLNAFLSESSARLALIMTGSGQVIAQHGFTRAIDVMSTAALGAGIVASAQELARLMSWPPFTTVVHQGEKQGHYLCRFDMPVGTWIGLAVFGQETTVGLVQLFFSRLVTDLAAAAPRDARPREVLPADFERDLNASLRTLFGR